jgi:hypothetical protein
VVIAELAVIRSSKVEEKLSFCQNRSNYLSRVVYEVGLGLGLGLGL